MNRDELKEKYQEISLLIQQECAVGQWGMNDYIANHLAEKIVTLIAPILADAEKWKNHQHEIARANAEIERFITLMQSDEDKLRTDAEKWRKVKECADSRPPCKCPLWYNDACNLEYGGCIFRDVVDALEAEVKG